MVTRYQEPNRAARTANLAVRWLAEMGVSIAGTRAVRVLGRKTGQPRSVVVNLLSVDGVDYLVSPRGNTQWVRNVRAAGVVELGPRRHRTRALVREVDDAVKPDIVRRYLARWYWQVRGFVPAWLTPDSSDGQLRTAAPLIPVFALAPAAAPGASH
ncbi:nitroreductase family deazaflavin-dependent oxidoreductase [Mycobacterium sp. Lab-001]|uniref:nitroreductase family deazaflavin-dependent oxidoreductase n=1 Tax=Mycobacterium sp. Lab-001 TaxID=3410136 RepID=UPI003D164605